MTQSLTSLFQSFGGQHLSAYIRNSGHPLHLRKHLRSVIQTAEGHLSGALPEEERRRFLQPLRNLLDDYTLLNGIKENLALFRAADSFRLISLPVDVEPSCIVADSFHVKPLIKWLQLNREFVLLGVNERSVSLYSGDHRDVHPVGTAIFPERESFLSSLDEITRWLEEELRGRETRVYVAGELPHLRPLLDRLGYLRIRRQPIWPVFSEDQVSRIVDKVRLHLRVESRMALQKTLVEFRRAEEGDRVQRNIFQIAKAAIHGRVAKLIVADGLHIFGKLDRKTGGLAIHPVKLDHEDDDLLDDLAQIVLEKGGEVFVANRKEIPSGRALLALLHGEDDDQRPRFAYSRWKPTG